MSTMKMDSFCNKFQANIFNKSKCQNCFKSRELHLRTNEDLSQAKPIYGGWLCLAPEGTDFGNPAQRSRKWQRRFFILYEHGSLHFALDESPNTLPQGTVNMNLCTDVVDAENKTGQRNALCIITPDQEFFIRGENKDIINGWSEQLVVYPLTNKQNRKKTKSKGRPPVSTQVPGNDKPPEVTCGISSDSAQKNCGQQSAAKDQLAALPSSGSSCLGKDSTPLPSSGSQVGASHGQQDSEANANNHVDSQPVTSAQSVPASGVCSSSSSPGARRGEGRQEELFPVPEKSEVWRGQAEMNSEMHVEDPISSNSSSSLHPPQKTKGHDPSCTPHSLETRAQSPDPRGSESVMTPDLLNFKKGWLMILEEPNQWKKNWFVLSTHKLRYYRDSVAEEASDLVGEMDLTTCHQVTEHQVQRNYGFQIHTQTQVHTLAAMTAGIRRNWIQALAKNVRPSNAPDVTNLSDDLCPFGSSAGALPEPDLTRDSLSPEVSAKMRHATKSRSNQKRRESGHSKPCGGAALRLNKRSSPKGDDDDEPTMEMWSVERRRRRREERRKRYESVMGSVLELGCQEDDDVQVGTCTGTGTLYAHQSAHEQQQQRAREIEERWQRVEKTGIREERRVPLYPDTQAKDVGALERLLHNYKRRVEELTAQLAGSCNREEQSLDQQMNSTWDLQLENSDVPENEETPVEMDSSPYRSHLSSLTHKYKETKELLRLEEMRRQQIQEQLSIGPSAVNQSSLSLCDALMVSGQGSPPSETSCPELLKHLSFTSFEELCSSSSAGQVTQCPLSQSESDIQVNSDVEKKKLVQEVATLSCQNEALNQQNQEMLHQLTEADREIERLRAELDERQDGRTQVSALEELTSVKVEHLENELREKYLELQEIQAQLDAQSEKLRDALSRLQLREATLEGLGFLPCTEKDHQSHAPLREALDNRLEDQLDYTELHAREAQGQEAASTPVMSCCQRDEVILSQVPLDVHRTQNSETESEEQASNGPSPDEVSIQRLMDEIQTRSEALGSLLKGSVETDLPTLVPSSTSERQDFDTNRCISDRLRQEEEVWATLAKSLKDDPLLLCAEAGVSHGLTAEVAGARLEEIKLYLSAHKHFSPSPINAAIVNKAPDASQAPTNDGSVLPESGVSGAETAELTAEVPEQRAERILSLCKRICSDSLWKELTASVNLKASLLKCVASSLDSSVNTELRCTVQDLCSLWQRTANPELINIQAVGSELLSAYIVSRLEAVQEKYIQTEASLWDGVESCQNCQVLRQKNKELCSRLSDIENQRSEGQKRDKEFPRDSSCSDGAQVKAVGQEVMVNPLHDNSSDQIKTNMPTDLTVEEPVSEVPGLESRTENKAVNLTAPVNGASEPESGWPSTGDSAELSGDECDGNVSALQQQYRRDLESLQAVCEQAFEAMEEAHQRALAELHLQHQRELDQCQQDKERLLAEETAATVAAIEAMKKAHQEELEKVLEGRHSDNCNPGSGDVEEILKKHSEELCSIQRELDVLSQQYCLKCLESAHLAQALEAERHALQQCQRQYQEISVRHQELCGGLARETIIPFPLSKEAPILQEKILYELQMGLRVKRAEVDCLKQEICSLKEELQTAHRDKRYATEKCTDMHKELSTTKARAEHDTEELREHLRLLYKALETSSVEEHLDGGDND